MKIGEKIKKLRTDAGLSETVVADYLNVSQPFLLKMEKGEVQIDTHIIKKISELFIVKPSVFLEDIGDSSVLNAIYKMNEFNSEDLKAISAINRIVLNLKEMYSIWELFQNTGTAQKDTVASNRRLNQYTVMRGVDESDNLALILREKLEKCGNTPVDISDLSVLIGNLTLIKYPFGENIVGMYVKQENHDIIAINSALSEYCIFTYNIFSKDEKMKTVGSYIKSAEELYRNKLISTGKFEELLSDAFRDDLVYGIDHADEYICN